ncbi:hypothetical protein ABTA91_18985, partial [Acinetobacter baumannii]
GGKIINLKSVTGGDGGAKGGGGKVTVNQNGSITTEGATSFGILAQSIGGGGGLGASAVDRSGWDPLNVFTTRVGGANGENGSGGTSG